MIQGPKRVAAQPIVDITSPALPLIHFSLHVVHTAENVPPTLHSSPTLNAQNYPASSLNTMPFTVRGSELEGSRGGGADDRDAYNGDQNESPRDQYPRTGNETSERRPAGPGESNQRSVAADDRGGDDGAEMSSPQCEFRCYRMDMLTAQTCRATRMRTLRRQQLSPQTLQPLRSATSTTTERVSTPADGCIKFGA